jgi:hypothetical protein
MLMNIMAEKERLRSVGEENLSRPTTSSQYIVVGLTLVVLCDSIDPYRPDACGVAALSGTPAAGIGLRRCHPVQLLALACPPS